MIDFSTLQGLTIPEGVVTQIAKDGVVLWKLNNISGIALKVKKVTSGSSSFIKLNIYPKTNGTVSVTYGGLTKTITDTSGVESPNAVAVEFNDANDGVTTPSSGILTIEGDCASFGAGTYTDNSSGKAATVYCDCITSIISFGDVTFIETNAFSDCFSLEEMIIPSSITSIHREAFYTRTDVWNGTFLSIDKDNPVYSFKNSCLITKSDNKVIYGFSDAVIPDGISIIGEESFEYRGMSSQNFIIPNGVKTIENYAFRNSNGMTDVTVPASVTSMGEGVFYGSDIQRAVFLGTTPPSADETATTTYMFNTDKNSDEPVTIIVPKGCGSIYKSAPQFRLFADNIVEVS